MGFELPELEYAYDALEPHIDAETMELHHSKHHAGYTANLNAAIDGTDMGDMSIEEFMVNKFDNAAVRNNGGGSLQEAIDLTGLFIETGPVVQIKSSSGRIEIEKDFEVGDEVAEEIKIEDFGRRAVILAKQTLIQRVKDLEKEVIISKYDELVGEIITGEIYQTLSREVLLVDSEGNEISLPRSEQIYKDKYRKGDTLRGVVSSVEMFRGNPRITLSRTSPVFLEKLFENEVPEIADGLITIKKVVREPGERAKICVESYDDRIDPVGACVGMNGSRIHSIVRELQNENIDVINFTDNQELYISRALSPAKITSMKIDNEEKTVSVYLKPDQVSLAIGKGGQNIKLASRLLDLEIDVFRELDESQEEDVDIEEFSDEIEGWIIDELKRIGLDTAKAVLNLDKEDLIKRADLEESTIDEVISTLKKEFE